MMMASVLGLGPSAAHPQSTRVTPTDSATAAGEKIALRSLLDVPTDDDAHDKLIAKLEATLPTAADAEILNEEPVVEAVSPGRRIALITQEVRQETVAKISAIWNQLSSGQSMFSGLPGNEVSILLEALPDQLQMIGITISVFLVLRALAKGFYARLSRRAKRSGFVGTVSLFLLSNTIDLLIVLLAWRLGYLATIFAEGEFGSIGIRQSMYLNAFLSVEVGKVVVRMSCCECDWRGRCAGWVAGTGRAVAMSRKSPAGHPARPV